jgi:hypothetical protein
MYFATTSASNRVVNNQLTMKKFTILFTSVIDLIGFFRMLSFKSIDLSILNKTLICECSSDEAQLAIANYHGQIINEEELS